MEIRITFTRCSIYYELKINVAKKKKEKQQTQNW